MALDTGILSTGNVLAGGKPMYTTPRPPLIPIRNSRIVLLWQFLGETREHHIGPLFTNVDITEEEESAFIEWLNSTNQ